MHDHSIGLYARSTFDHPTDMRSCFLPFLLVLLVQDMLAQSGLLYPWDMAGGRFDWSTVQEIDDIVLKDRLVRQMPMEFDAYLGDWVVGRSIADLMDDLHVLDINGDGQGDIIFDGESGGEPLAIKVFLNRVDRFEMVLSTQQDIVQLLFQNGRLDKILIKDAGCCAETLHWYQVFRFVHDGPDVRVTSETAIRGCEQMVWPEKRFNEPVPFKVLNHGYNLRLSPEPDDAGEFHHGGEFTIGNVIAKLPQGATGVALGNTIDDTGREWWFVAIRPGQPLIDGIYYEVEGAGDHKLGWVSSRFVEVLEQEAK